jgi:folylpolyglutamate synthase/dihydropteroate synthase
LLIRDFLTKHEMRLVPQPLHSQDLALLLTQLKSILKGWWCESAEEIKENSLEELCKIPKEKFQKCFLNWKKPWEWCIKIGG